MSAIDNRKSELELRKFHSLFRMHRNGASGREEGEKLRLAPVAFECRGGIATVSFTKDGEGITKPRILDEGPVRTMEEVLARDEEERRAVDLID